MQQQLLQLQLPEHYDYHEWIRHAGVENACNRLALWLVHGGNLWLTSDEMAGKSHLLSLLQNEHPSLGLVRVAADDQRSSLQRVQQWMNQLQPFSFWAVDVDARVQPMATLFALFHLLERARDLHRPLLLAWRIDAQQILPPELGSRIRGMLERVDMQPPGNDDERQQVLRAVAESMQWHIDERMLRILLQMLPRRLESLIPALQYLENISRNNRRQRLSQQWVREQLHQWNTQRASA